MSHMGSNPSQPENETRMVVDAPTVKWPATIDPAELIRTVERIERKYSGQELDSQTALDIVGSALAAVGIEQGRGSTDMDRALDEVSAWFATE